MPTYEFQCANGHNFEHRCSISNKPNELPCPVEIELPAVDVSCTDSEHEQPCSCQCPKTEKAPCGAEATQVFRTAPPIWIPGVTHNTVLDYPGSKAHKAGFQMSHGNIGVKKVSVGAGGALNPRTHREHPLASAVIPDPKTSVKRRLRTEGVKI